MRSDGESTERGTARIERVGTLLTAVTAAVLAVVLGRVALLQWSPPERLEPFMRGRVSGLGVEMPRGDLLDRQGRLLAASRFAWQAIVDPTRVPDEPGVWIAQLAEMIGEPADEVGLRVIEAVARNDEIRAGVDPDADVTIAPEEGMESHAALLNRLKGVIASRVELETGGGREDTAEPRVRRYLPVGELLEREQADKLAAARLAGVTLERRLVRVTDADADLASIVGKVGFGHQGLLGVERSLEPRLEGTPSRLRAVRDAKGRPLWIESGSLRPGERGEDVRLSFDRVIQRIAREELERGVVDADAAGGRLVAVDPETGEILAMVDILRPVADTVEVPWRPAEPAADDPDPGRREAWRALTDAPVRPRFAVVPADERRLVHPAMGRNRCLEDVYEPGSTFKAFVWSSAFESGLLTGDGVRTDPGGYRTPYGRHIEDVTKLTELSWDGVLLHSSNIGMVKISEQMSHAELREIVTRFGFGKRTALPLPGESRGIVTSAASWDKYTQTSIAMGYEVAVTPVQMVRAFSALARSGEAAGTVPSLTLTAVESDAPALVVERVLQPGTVVHARRVLAGVVERMDTSKRRRYPDDPEPTYSLFGKSGTAKIPMTPPPGMRRPRGAPGYYDKQYNSSFIAAGPVEQPAIVVLVVIDDPGPSLVRRNEYYGSSVAGPVVRRFSERALRYLGVEPDLPVERAGSVAALDW